MINIQPQQQMPNAQQQQFYNYQQQQQAPQIASNSLFTNAQMQMNSNAAQYQQINMQMPMQQMPIQQIAPQMGYYGNRQRTREPMDV